jgi:hypothetical protein
MRRDGRRPVEEEEGGGRRLKEHLTCGSHMSGREREGRGSGPRRGVRGEGGWVGLAGKARLVRFVFFFFFKSFLTHLFNTF